MAAIYYSRLQIPLVAISLKEARKYLPSHLSDDQIKEKIERLQPLVHIAVATAIYQKNLSKTKIAQYDSTK